MMEKEITREYVRECDMDRTYPYEAYEKIARQGWLRPADPRGPGRRRRHHLRLRADVRGPGTVRLRLRHRVLVPTFTAMNIVKFGTAAQQERVRASRS